MRQINRNVLITALSSICENFEESATQLNALDAQLGDGDLGSTLSAIAITLKPTLKSFPDDLSTCLREIVNVIAATSGSSFSTVSMFGLLKAADEINGKDAITVSDIPTIIDSAIIEMSRRGGANLGDKTVLDGLNKISSLLSSQLDARPATEIAKEAVKLALLEFKNKPSKIGRARLASERSVGIDDPGMYALHLLVESL